MLFTEPVFLFVFLPVLLAWYFVPSKVPRNGLLLVASLVFYARGGGAFTGLVLVLVAANYQAALAIDRRRDTPAARRLLAATVAGDLLVLGVFKYTGFVVGNANALLSLIGLSPVPAPTVLLPIGISFLTFHAISYVVDVYRRDAAAQKGPVEAGLYLLLFPQLIAGPIVRYRDIADQIGARAITVSDVADGVRRFTIGLGKKMLVANIVAGPADRIFAMPTAELTAGHAWLGVLCYTLQIYFDFSGYSDMAIGLGRMFGFRFPENFRYPYVADSIQEFWRRWHMSLSTWFRDYLYVPLGGNRVSMSRLYLNLVAVFFLCGLWHGASWTFAIWGLYHGGFLVLERLFVGRWLQRAPRALAHAYTMLAVMTGWVFFRADSLSAALGMIAAMVGLGQGAPTLFAPAWYATPELLAAVVAGLIGMGPVVPWLGRRMAGAQHAGPAELGWAASACVALGLSAVLTASIMLIAAGTYNPFIYFRF